eukprot:gene3489-1871_t
MASGTLYTYKDSFRAFKTLIAAEYSGAKVNVFPNFEFGKTNKSPEFLKKFPLGKRPARKVPFDRTSTSFTFPCEFLPSTDILEDSSNNEANDHSAVLPERDYARGVVDDEQFLSLLSDHTSLKQKVSELQAQIILDCTEIFTEVPSSMVAQSQTWSEYKHHNTWKSLIGVSPNGAIIFVSKLWSGKVSDREITLKSGVLSLLEPGDNIMADRGFNIFDILPCGVSLNIPPFKGSRSQLTPQEAEETANIAAVRIHVERAIGRVKNYHILDGVLPLSLYPVANQIFTVCCYLTNFLPFLVKPANNED